MASLHVATPLLQHGSLSAALALAYGQAPFLKEFHAPLIGGGGGIGVDLAKLDGWMPSFER